MTEFSQRIFELRKENRLTQEEIAEKLSVSRQTISNWETGSAQPTIDKAIELAELYEVSMDELIGRTKQTTKKVSQLLFKMIGREVTIYFELKTFITKNLKCTILEVLPTTVRVKVVEKKDSYEQVLFLNEIVGFEMEGS